MVQSTRRSWPIASVMLMASLGTAIVLQSALGAAGVGSAGAVSERQGIFKLDHLIFIVQENRSFDHYFGTFPGADGLPGPPGPKGDKGDPGETRTTNVTSIDPVLVSTATRAISGSRLRSVPLKAVCPPGLMPIAGGGSTNVNAFAINSSRVNESNGEPGWQVQWVRTPGVPISADIAASFTVNAYCVVNVSAAP